MGYLCYSGSFYNLQFLQTYIFRTRNRKVINGWGWYLFYESLIFCMGLYILTYTGNSLAIVVGLTSMFYSGLLLGTSLDLQRHEHPNWGNLTIAGILGILFHYWFSHLLCIRWISYCTFMAFSFIAISVSSVLLSLEFKK